MKKLIILGWAGLLATSIQAQTIVNHKASGMVPGRPTSGNNTGFQITESGANYRIWQRTNYQATAAGEKKAQTHRIVELAIGLNYQDATSGQWVPAKEEIDAYPGGAIAQFGQHKVIFANNLNSAKAIDLKMSDGGEMQSDVMGLSYYDSASGKSVLLAEVKDCQGEIVDQNQVIYTNAFDRLNADVRYTYTKAGLEQDIILLEQPPAPESYGLSSASTVLQVMTEFTSAPTPAIKRLPGTASEDEILDFGAMKMIHGKAFLMGASSKTATVAKQWAVIGGRQILLESVHVPVIAKSLDQLPDQSSIQPGKSRTPYLVSNERELPPSKTVKATKGQMALAGRTPADHGFVLDYATVDGSSGDVDFGDGSTYFISGPTYCDDVTLEGGTVIKYPNDTTAFLEVDGNLTCQTGPYHPAIFTAGDDDSVGDPLTDEDGGGWAGYTGSIQPGTYANPAIQFTGVMHDVRISYAQMGVLSFYGGDYITISDSQIIDCNYGVGMTWYAGPVTLNNCLIASPDFLAANAFSGGSTCPAYSFSTFNLSFCTVDNYSELTATGIDGSYVGDLYAADSIFTDIGDFGSGSLSGGYNGFYNTPSTFGDSPTVDDIFPYTAYSYSTCIGYYFLGDGSFTGVSTTDPGYVPDPAVLADISQKTTQPPVDDSYYGPGGTELGPTAGADSSCSDLGYHHDRLDYVFLNSYIPSYQTSLVFDPGTAVGWYGSGLYVPSNCVVSFNGTAASPCYFVGGNTVLETGGGVGVGINNQTVNPPVINASFTHFSEMTYSSYFHNDGYDKNAITVSASNCEFGDGYLYEGLEGGISLNLFNCLLHGIDIFLSSYVGGPTNSLSLVNCTAIGGNIGFFHWPGALPLDVDVTNCAFDGTVITGYNYANETNIYCKCNAYLSGGDMFSNHLAATDVSVSGSYNWQAGPFGYYYLPTNSTLINAGSVPAGQLGLSEYTTQTNQANDTGTTDIGYHYPIVYPADDNGSSGTSFWTAFPDLDRNGESANQLSLLISGRYPTTGTVTIPGIGFTTNFTVTPPLMTTVCIPNEAMLTNFDGIQTNGINITAGDFVSVYGLCFQEFSSESFTAYPAPMMGTNYCLMARQSDLPDPSSSEFAIVATMDDTHVTITPSATADLDYSGSLPINITLQQGQTFMLSSVYDDYINLSDVTGTFVTSDNPVAVLGGANGAETPTPAYSAVNPLVEELLPTSFWGRQVLGLSLGARTNGVIYRILAETNGTAVTVNGTSLTNLYAGESIDIIMDTPVDIRGSQPIQVAQFSPANYYDLDTTFDFGEGLATDYPIGPSGPYGGEGQYIGTGDPSEMLLPSTDHYMNAYTVCTPDQFSTNETDFYTDYLDADSLIVNYLNLMVEPSAVASTYIDGQLVPTNSFLPIADSGYYGAQIAVTNGAHTVISSKPLGVQVYGFAQADAYSNLGGEANLPLSATPDFTNNVPVNTAATIDVLANDVFSNRTSVALSLAAAPAHGTCSTNIYNDIIYTPSGSYTGLDQFTYQIAENGNVSTTTVSVGVVGQQLVATNFTITADMADEYYYSALPVTTNAVVQGYDPNGHPLSVLSVGPATYGIARINGDNTVTYSTDDNVTLNDSYPDDNFTDSFTYTVSDGHGGTATGTITVNVSY